MDFQGRANSKPGAGGLMSSHLEKLNRKERLKRLAMENIDVSKDPYLIVNAHGRYECKLCLTTHKTEGNYLAHTQGRRHQNNLAKRAEKDAKYGNSNKQEVAAPITAPKIAVKKNVIKIGKPGYKYFKSVSPITGEKSLAFELYFPEIDADFQPRHRFMSAFEQQVEVKRDARFQYLLFAAEPYETVGFKIPNLQINKSEGMFQTSWDKESKIFKLKLSFVE